MLLLITLLLILSVLAILKRKAPPALSSPQIGRLFGTLCAIALVSGMITQPKIVFEGATSGLKIWWNIVLPSLLPFFIVSELLMSFGIVNFMGVLLEPVMRPLFKVPGTCSFAMAVAYTSGYPIGAMVTARLRSQRLCTRIEAERLMAFTNNSSPLFMLVAVAVGMFNNPQLGVIIAGAHYLANLTLGFLMRFYGKNDPEIIFPPSLPKKILKRAFQEIFRIYQEDKRPLGNIIGDAVKNAVNNLLNIGGFIILFAVLIRLLTAAGIINLLAQQLGFLLIPLGFSPSILPAIVSGLIEMTIGTKLATEASVPLTEQLVAVSIILAWSGLSVHAQAASMIAQTDIRMFPFIAGRLIHAILAALYTHLLIGPIAPIVAVVTQPGVLPLTAWHHGFSLWAGVPALITLFFMVTAIMMVAGIILNFISIKVARP